MTTFKAFTTLAAMLSLAAFADLPNAAHTPLSQEKFQEAFTKVPAKEINGKCFNPGVFLITGGNARRYNSMTAGWGGYGVLWSKPVAHIYVRNERFTYQFLEAEEIFTLSWYPEKEKNTVVKVFGTKSGRDTDKEQLSGYTPVSTPDGGVTYMQSDLVVVCKRVLRFPLSKDAVPEDIAKGVSDKSYHVQYTGEVLSVWKNNALIQREEQAAAETATAAALNNIFTRTSIRSYSDKPVEDAKVETILRAAMSAPTAGNKQPWNFIVVRDKQILAKLAAGINTARMTSQAQLAIVACGDTTNTFPEDGKDYWIHDISAASENILLAANAQGLGAVWCGVYPKMDRVKLVQELLSLPEHIVPLSLIPVGYPDEPKDPMDKWNTNKIFYNKYQTK